MSASEQHGTEDLGGGGHDEEVHEEGEPWLVSYADMMTLLFGFFVLMYSFAAAKLRQLNVDEIDKMVLIRKELSTFFGGTYITPLAKVAKEFEAKLKSMSPDENINTKLTPEGIEVTMQSSTIFPLGSSEPYGNALVLLRDLARLVRTQETTSGSKHKVIVEGHTDDVPIVRAEQYATNWELSAARAARVVRIFEGEGFPPQQLIAIGYGSSRPLLPNRNADGTPIKDNQAKNRRVHIKVALAENAKVQPKDSPKSRRTKGDVNE